MDALDVTDRRAVAGPPPVLPLSGAWRGGLASLVGALLRLRALWRARREMARLARLDDRMLRDIGVERADVDWALLQPWSVDPTLVLAERVRSRRASEAWVRRLSHQRRAPRRTLKFQRGDAYR